MRQVAGLLFGLALAAVLLPGCGGGAGVGGGGALTGTVVGNASGGASYYTPLSGVTVTAIRVEDPGLMRSVTTDANGRYYFGDLPVGSYELQFYSFGWTVAWVGVPGSGTVPNPVYVSAGSAIDAGSVQMTASGGYGDGTVVLTLADAATGMAVPYATVMVGAATASWSSGGTYTFSVPVSAYGVPQQIYVAASGYDPASASPSYVIPVAYETVYVTVYVRSSAPGSLGGYLQATSNHSYYASTGLLGAVTIYSDTVSQDYLNPRVDPSTGYFTVNVPAGGSGSYVNLYFSSPYFYLQAVTNVVVRPGGLTSLTSPVYLTPITVDVTGNVVTSSGGAPSGSPNQVVIVQLGRAATITGGSYSFGALPAGLTLTLQASAYNTATGRYETGYVTVTPVTGVGIFHAPTIYTGP